MARARTTTAGPKAPKARSDAWVGMLLVALLAQITGAVFLYLEWSSYPTTLAPKVQAQPTAGGSTLPAPGAQQGGGPPPGAQQGGGPLPGGQQGGAPVPPMQ